MNKKLIVGKKHLVGFDFSGLKSIHRYLFLMLLMPVCIVLTGCASLYQVVPIQMARVNQTEAYTQTFDFQVPRENTAMHMIERTQWFNHQIDDVFLRLLGETNWQQIKDRYGLGTLREELLRKEVYVRGFFNFSTYLDPVSPEFFVAEGIGRFFLVRQKNRAILLSGDFYISPDRHARKDLDRGYVVLDIKLILSRIPEEVTYLHEAPLKYKIFFDTTLKQERVYLLDYKRRHEVHLPLADNETLSDKTRIGSLQFDAKSEQAIRSKLLDYRGTEFLRGDYEKMLRRSMERQQEEVAE